jgi:hypothetical protein
MSFMNKLNRFLFKPFEADPAIPILPKVGPLPEAMAALEEKRDRLMDSLGNWEPEMGWLKYEKPTCQRVNLAEWKIQRARRKARSDL